MSDKTVSAASPQSLKTESLRIYRPTPYEHVSTAAPIAMVKRVGSSFSVGTTITKKPFMVSTRRETETSFQH